MPKPKPTISDQLDASNIVQNLIDNYEAQHRDEIPEGVQIALNRIYKRLIKADERLLQPKPRKPRKPKLTLASGKVTGSTPVHFEPDAYENSNPKTGRQKS